MELIAEIGLNHRGEPDAVQSMLAAVARGGVRKATLQLREPAFYDGTKPWKRALPFEVYRDFITAAKAAGVEPGFAVADEVMVPKLAEAGASFFKSLSWDLQNASLQAALARTGALVWLSTGVSSLDDIAAAARGRDRIGFIHTQLSAAIEDQNLRAIETMRAATHRPIAFGLHCRDHRVLHLALAMRPDALFVYVKPDAAGPYPDDAHAVVLDDLARLGEDLRELSRAVGTGEKHRMEKKL